jgi:hypothetical protein
LKKKDIPKWVRECPKDELPLLTIFFPQTDCFSSKS